VTWDASGSTSDGGTITAVETTLVGPDGTELKRETLSPPFTGSQSFDEDGDYSITATAIDGDGQRSTNSCRATFEVRPRARFSGWILGGVRRTDTPPPDGKETSGTFGIRGSLDWLLRERLDLSAGIGVALVVDGNPSVFADLTVDWKLSPTFFLGTGPGFWDIAHSDGREVDWLVRAGYDTPWSMGGWDTALVVEGRVSLESSGNSIAVLGLRLREQ
jgi:hypothetical protein